jgi:septum site-determining protein MinC
MMTVKSNSYSLDKTFRLKGSMVTVMVMEILQADLRDFPHQLHAKVSSAPDFFQDTPIVFSLDKLEKQESIDFISLIDACRTNSMFPFAVKGGSEQQLIAARSAGLVRISGGKVRPEPADAPAQASEPVDGYQLDEPPSPLHPAKLPTKMVTQPIRSGQQVYAKGGDLVVLSSVSEGAEILADGNIHVYGTLRGRALAGVQGDENARIFCSHLDASLVSIAGVYLLNDNIEKSLLGKNVQISLDEEQLNISAL